MFWALCKPSGDMNRLLHSLLNLFTWFIIRYCYLLFGTDAARDMVVFLLLFCYSMLLHFVILLLKEKERSSEEEEEEKRGGRGRSGIEEDEEEKEAKAEAWKAFQERTEQVKSISFV